MIGERDKNIIIDYFMGVYRVKSKPYDKSWDLLMPVIAKIYNISPGDQKERLSIRHSMSMNININDTYPAVVSFIDKYLNNVIAEIIGYTCDYFSITYDDLMSKNKEGNVILARQILMYYLYRVENYSSLLIGEILDRNHPSVLNGVKSINNIFETDGKLSSKLTDFFMSLENHLNNSKYR